MDAATSAAVALDQAWVLFRNPSVPRLGLPPSAYQLTYDEYKAIARTVLSAVGYDALRAERDHYREALEQIGAASPRNAYAIARKALGGPE